MLCGTKDSPKFALPGNDLWQVSMKGPSTVYPTINDNSDGTYLVEYICKVLIVSASKLQAHVISECEPNFAGVRNVYPDSAT